MQDASLGICESSDVDRQSYFSEDCGMLGFFFVLGIFLTAPCVPSYFRVTPYFTYLKQ